jgi:hypothetical protein
MVLGLMHMTYMRKYFPIFSHQVGAKSSLQRSRYLTPEWRLELGTVRE